MHYIIILIYLQSVVSLPFLMNLYTKTCFTNQPLHLEQSLSLPQGMKPDLEKPIDFGYIYIMHSPAVRLNADIDTQIPRRASAILSHLTYHEPSNSLSLEAWVSPANGFKIKDLRDKVYLELRTFSFDPTRRSWLDKFTNRAQIAAQVKSMQLFDSDPHGYQKVLLELNVPFGWLNDSRDKQCKQEKTLYLKDQFHEIIDSAVLM